MKLLNLNLFSNKISTKLFYFVFILKIDNDAFSYLRNVTIMVEQTLKQD